MRRTSRVLRGELRVDPPILRKSAQRLVVAIDDMLWTLQNMPDGDKLRSSLVGCKTELDAALESIGYTLKVRGGFRTVVTKIRQPRQDTQMTLKPSQPGLDDAQPAPQPQVHSLVARIAARIVSS